MQARREVQTKMARWVAGMIATMALAVLPGMRAMAQSPAAVTAGQRPFLRCSACHQMNAAARPLLGPHLEGIVGRKVASVPAYPYTTALRAKHFIWTEAQLDRLLKRPQAIAPGLCLPFTGLASAADRKALIAYLKQPLP